MRLVSDYIHPTPRHGRCRIRVYLPEEERDAPVVICSELPNNGSTSVTCAAEQLAAEVIYFHGLPTLKANSPACAMSPVVFKPVVDIPPASKPFVVDEAARASEEPLDPAAPVCLAR